MFLEVCLGTTYWSTSTRPGPVTQGQRWISCLKEPTFCQKSQLVKLAKKLRKYRGDPIIIN